MRNATNGSAAAWLSIGISLTGFGLMLYRLRHPVMMMGTNDPGNPGVVWQYGGHWPAGAAELTLDDAARLKGLTTDELLTALQMGRVRPYRKWQAWGYSVPSEFEIDKPIHLPPP